MNSPFVSSPGMLSPGMEFPHGLSDFAMNEMVMSPLGQGTNMNQPAPLNPQQPQHTHHSLQGLQGHGLSPQHLQASLGHGGLGAQSLQGHQGLNTASMQASHPMNGGANSLLGAMSRQPPQRASSFAMQSSIPRTIGDFHALQRANSETSSNMAGMAGLGSEMDFGLR
jgi:hypothetical protein